MANWNTGFALTASPFWKDPKGTKRSSPHRTAFAALRFPRSGPAPWARRHGPSMAHRGSPGIHAGRPTPQNLLSASREGNQIKKHCASRRPTGRPVQFACTALLLLSLTRNEGCVRRDAALRRSRRKIRQCVVSVKSGSQGLRLLHSRSQPRSFGSCSRSGALGCGLCAKAQHFTRKSRIMAAIIC